MKYFAYGSNMSHRQMAERCPDSRFLEGAYLENHRLVFDGQSYLWGCPVCNIEKSIGNLVWGGLYEIGESDLNVLDKREGYPDRYDKKEFEVKDDEGRIVEAIVYFRVGQPKGEPSEFYLNTVLQGAHDCGLPGEYIEAIKSIAKERMVKI